MLDDLEQKIHENKNESVNDWIRHKYSMGRSPHTLNQYSYVAKRFFHQYFPQLSSDEVEVHHIEEFVRLLEQDYDPSSSGHTSISDNTKERYLSALSSFYSWALKRPKYPGIKSNPAGIIAEEITVNQRTRPDCATWENTCKIVQQIHDPRDRSIAVILAKTGCRVSEALRIELDDLLLEQGFIRLQSRKGGGETVVPVDSEVVKQVKKYRAMRRGNGSSYLFTTDQGNRLKQRRVLEIVRDAAVNAGVMEEGETRFHRKFTPHTFRTVFTTLMRKQEMSDHILKYIRGDSAENMLDLYTRVDREEARTEYLECIKKLQI